MSTGSAIILFHISISFDRIIILFSKVAEGVAYEHIAWRSPSIVLAELQVLCLFVGILRVNRNYFIPIALLQYLLK